MAIFKYDETLKRNVEIGSGGKQTVLVTPNGVPCVMNVFEKMNIEDLMPEFSADTGITGVHPAFKIGGKTASRIYIGTYCGDLKNSELISQPNLTGHTGRDAFASLLTSTKQFDTKGWHPITNMEWEFVKALYNKNTDRFYYPDSTGRSASDNTLFGIRADGKPAGTPLIDGANLNGRLTGLVLNGSGPVEFRLNNEFTGLSDLFHETRMHVINTLRMIGNPTDGFELQVYGQNNDAAASVIKSRISESDPNWYAFDATTGGFLKPTYTGSVANQDYVPTTPNSIRLLTTGTRVSTMPKNLITVNSWPNGTFVDYAQLPKAVCDILALYGFWHHPTMKDPTGLVLNVSLWSWTGTGQFANPYGGPVQSKYTGRTGMRLITWTHSGYNDYPNTSRICYYDPADLS